MALGMAERSPIKQQTPGDMFNQSRRWLTRSLLVEKVDSGAEPWGPFRSVDW
jgi:hypothetical protein